MATRYFLAGLFALLAWGQIQAQTATAALRARFEENKGQIWRQPQAQVADEVRYVYRQGGLSVFLLPDGLAYQFAQVLPRQDSAKLSPVQTWRMDLRLLGANPQAEIIAQGPSPDYTHYYNRDVLEVRHYQSLTYREVYPHIDWVVYSHEQGLKYDFILHPGADPGQIRLQFSGHEDLALLPDGSLKLGNRLGYVQEKAPESFQNGQRIPSRFKLEGNTLSFELGAYNPQQTLRIDPEILWATYYGGTSGPDIALTCATDSLDNVYIAGATNSLADIASPGGEQLFLRGETFIAKFNAAGIRAWGIYYGGEDLMEGIAYAETSIQFWLYRQIISISPLGEVYLVGRTSQPDSRLVANSPDTLYKGGASDAFVVKFNTQGYRIWGRYLGGGGMDGAQYCVVDNSANLYVLGETSSPTGVFMGGYLDYRAGYSAYLSKLDSSGAYLWGTYTPINVTMGATVTRNNDLVLVGRTHNETDVATSNAYQTTLNPGGNPDGLVMRFSADGTRLWGTYYGGQLAEEMYTVAEAPDGALYVSGQTSSPSGIAFNGYQDSMRNSLEPFLVKFTAQGQPIWGTYYSGWGNPSCIYGRREDHPYCLVDSSGCVYLIGATCSTEGIATAEGIAHQIRVGSDGRHYNGFFVKFDSSGRRIFGSYFPNTRNTWIHGASMSRQGYLYLAGRTLGDEIWAGGHEPLYGGLSDGFLAKIAISPTVGVEVLPPSRQAGSFLVFPNPATQLVTLVLPQGLSGQVQLHCYNSLGQLLRQTQLEASGSSLEYSLQDLAPGLYYLQLRQGEKTWTASLRVQ